jgi:hypothetical protein
MKALKPIDTDKLSEADAWKIINGVQIAQNELNVQALILPLIMDATQYLALKSDFLLDFSMTWSSTQPLERRCSTLPPISLPQPDLTLGLNQDTLPVAAALVSQEMGGYFQPAGGDTKLLCPFFAVETKGWQSESYATLQNVHNAAIMVRNLREVRARAGIDVQNNFDNKAHVLTLVFTKSGMELCCGWYFVGASGCVEYHYTVLEEWRAPKKVAQATEMVICIRKAIAWCAANTKAFIPADIEAIAKKIEADEMVL